MRAINMGSDSPQRFSSNRARPAWGPGSQAGVKLSLRTVTVASAGPYLGFLTHKQP